METIDSDQFVEMSHIVAMDAAVAGLAVAARPDPGADPDARRSAREPRREDSSRRLSRTVSENRSPALVARLAEYERGRLLSSSTRSTVPSCKRLGRLVSETWSAWLAIALRSGEEHHTPVGSQCPGCGKPSACPHVALSVRPATSTR